MNIHNKLSRGQGTDTSYVQFPSNFITMDITEKNTKNLEKYCKIITHLSGMLCTSLS